MGVSPQSTVTADLNDDGKQDIVVLNHGQFPDLTSSVSVLLGNGDGSFRPALTTGLLRRRDSVAVGDFNRDGRLDLVIANSVNNVVEVLRGNGDGSFQSNHLVIGVGQGPASVAVGDFDRNGALDLVTANSGSDTVSVLRGNGDGSFQPRIDLAVGSQPTRSRSMTSTATAGPTWCRRTSAAAPSACCWATATARSGRPSALRPATAAWGLGPWPWATSTATAGPTWCSGNKASAVITSILASGSCWAMATAPSRIPSSAAFNSG